MVSMIEPLHFNDSKMFLKKTTALDPILRITGVCFKKPLMKAINP